MSPSLASIHEPSGADGGGSAGMDRAAFETWVRTNQRALVAYARALVSDPDTARELSQEALMLGWRFRERFDGDKGDFGAWVRGILRNKWRELGRRKKLVLVEEAELEGIEGLHRQWEQAAEDGRGELIERVEECVNKLSGPLAEAVRGTYFSGWSGPELAERLKTSEAALRKRLQRAREAVRECLEGGA